MCTIRKEERIVHRSSPFANQVNSYMGELSMIFVGAGGERILGIIRLSIVFL